MLLALRAKAPPGTFLSGCSILNRTLNLICENVLGAISLSPIHPFPFDVVLVSPLESKFANYEISCSAFVNSILSVHQSVHGIPRKVGLYTSPHLIAVRERIRINSEPIAEDIFAKYFFEVWDALEESAVRDGRDPRNKPVYFRFLTLMSFHVFISEGVDTAIYEVGIGGAWDSTNIFKSPAVTGITTLGIDHVVVLGDTIEQIAWHKAGIFKEKCPAFTVEQVPSAAQVLQDQAACKKVHLETVKINPAISDYKIVPDADFQRQNASLAVALVGVVLQRLGHPSLPNGKLSPEIKQGLENTVWRGRCEVATHSNATWYLDGAHTADSLKVAGRWFAGLAQAVPRILVFNQQSRPEAASLLRTLYESIDSEIGPPFDHVIFCTNVTRKGTGYRTGRAAQGSVVCSKG